MELIEREKIQWFGCNFENEKTCKDARGICKKCFFATCNHDQVMNLPTVPAIPMERIKQLREEIEQKAWGQPRYEMIFTKGEVLELIDNMIKEYSDGAEVN